MEKVTGFYNGVDVVDVEIIKPIFYNNKNHIVGYNVHYKGQIRFITRHQVRQSNIEYKKELMGKDKKDLLDMLPLDIQVLYKDELPKKTMIKNILLFRN